MAGVIAEMKAMKLINASDLMELGRLMAQFEMLAASIRQAQRQLPRQGALKFWDVPDQEIALEALRPRQRR